MRIIERPSPNHDERPARVDMLVLHYTGMETAEEALARLCDPAAKVSAHYTIDEDGQVYRHVPEDRRAWHAGVSWWAGRPSVNNTSVGIELVNPGHEFGYRPFPAPQIASLIDLASGIIRRHHIPARRVLGHSDVAPGRKTDPGELFPWQQIADFGIGVWPRPARRAEPPDGDFAAKLAAFGYGAPPAVEVTLDAVITAFQRHFRPSCVNGVADAECAVLLDALLAL